MWALLRKLFTSPVFQAGYGPALVYTCLLRGKVLTKSKKCIDFLKKRATLQKRLFAGKRFVCLNPNPPLCTMQAATDFTVINLFNYLFAADSGSLSQAQSISLVILWLNL